MPPSLLCGEESICTNCFGSFEGDLVRLDILDFLLFMLLLCNESSCALSALDVFPGISDMASDGATDTESSARSTCSSSSSSSEIISSSEVAVKSPRDYSRLRRLFSLASVVMRQSLMSCATCRLRIGRCSAITFRSDVINV